MPFRGMVSKSMNHSVEIRFIAGGSCSAPAFLAGGRGFKRVTFPALVAWIKHPMEGEMLFDTGYGVEGLDRMKTFPSAILASLLKPSLASTGTLPEQLERLGSSASNIRRIFLSHFHYDHASALSCFPSAEFIVSREAWEASRAIRRRKEGPAAYSSTLIPADFVSRVRFLENSDAASWEGFAHTWDLFGDGLLRAIGLPGHAPGQAGLLVESRYFLIADAAWLAANLKGDLPPRWVLRIAQSNAKDWLSTLNQLRSFSEKHADVHMVPSHCAETFAALRT